jgi:hypothetical protein
LSVRPETQEKILEVVRFCVKENKPIRFVMNFGGYKLFRMPTAPEVDWAEFFSIAYYAQYVAPLLKAHPAGVSFVFSSGDMVVNLVNNISAKDTGRYFDSFRDLITAFKKHFPGNLDMSITRLSDLFENTDEFEKAIEPFLGAARQQLQDDEKKLKKREKGALFNINWDGHENWSSLSEPERDKKILRAAEVVGSMYRPEKVRDYIQGPDTISVFATAFTPSDAGITLGTSKRSMAKFWAGMGVLAKDGGNYGDYVITPKQWEKVKDLPHETIDSSLVDLENLKRVILYPGPLQFGV